MKSRWTEQELEAFDRLEETLESRLQALL
jgi:hypothetical protein